MRRRRRLHRVICLSSRQQRQYITRRFNVSLQGRNLVRLGSACCAKVTQARGDFEGPWRYDSIVDEARAQGRCYCDSRKWSAPASSKKNAAG